jgi:hypothetical protein
MQFCKLGTLVVQTPGHTLRVKSTLGVRPRLCLGKGRPPPLCPVRPAGQRIGRVTEMPEHGVPHQEHRPRRTQLCHVASAPPQTAFSSPRSLQLGCKMAINKQTSRLQSRRQGRVGFTLTTSCGDTSFNSRTGNRAECKNEWQKPVLLTLPEDRTCDHTTRGCGQIFHSVN